MKKILLFLLLSFSLSSYGQKYIKPNNSYGYEWNRIKPDSVLHVPVINNTLLHTTDTSAQIRIINGILKYWWNQSWHNTGGEGADSSLMKSNYQAHLDTSKLHNQIITKQATLVSGTNIKTINNTDLTGPGNIIIKKDSTWNSIKIGTKGDTTIINNFDLKKYHNGSLTALIDTGCTLFLSNPNNNYSIGNNNGDLNILGGTYNIGIGRNSLTNLGTGGNYNNGFGNYTLSSLSTGTNNTGIGYFNLFSLQTGSYNTGIGSNCLYSIRGSNNIGLGYNAGYHLQNYSNRLIISSISQSNLADDTSKSIIYGYQNSTIANQRLYLNVGKIYISGDLYKSTTDTFPTFSDVRTYVRTHSSSVDTINKIATQYDLSTKQPTLVSGTNIKTINSTSLLGSGDITITAGIDIRTGATFVPATGIQLDKFETYYTNYTITGALTVTAASSPQEGYRAYGAFVADGTNVPNISAFTLWDDVTYVNTNGVVNHFAVWRKNGVNYWSWHQLP